MNRRDFLQIAAAGAGAALFPGRVLADSWKDSFDAALRGDASLLAYRSAEAETLTTPRLDVRGRFPAGLRGVLYRNGPARHDLGGTRYRHWFDGDGMVQAFRIGEGGVSHTGRFVHTRKFVAESAAGKFRVPAFGTHVASATEFSSPDTLNAANTSVLPFAGELLALWEGGSAYQLDPESLATVGAKVWRRDLRGMPFSAHPRIEPDGTLWNFGVVNGRGLVLYEVSARGALVRAEMLPVDAVPMVHDFALTARSLVFLLPPLVLDQEKMRTGASFLDSHTWDKNAPMRVLVVDKADWSRRRWLELPGGFLFHLGNAWEDAAGVIRLDYMRSDNPSAMFRSFREVMRGAGGEGAGTHSTLVTLDVARGIARQQSRTEHAEFPRIDARVTGQRYGHLYSLYATQARSDRYGLQGVQRLDLENGTIDRYDYGHNFFPEEHVHVPDHGRQGEGSGWLLGTAIDLKRKVTILSVFEARNLGAGPIAQASLPYALPAGFHGNFLPVPA